MRTGNKPAALTCNLGRFMPDSINTEDLKRDGWNTHRILVVAENDERLGWIERQVISQIGDKLYGR